MLQCCILKHRVTNQQKYSGSVMATVRAAPFILVVILISILGRVIVLQKRRHLAPFVNLSSRFTP